MTDHSSNISLNTGNHIFDLSQIFIAREQPVDLFKIYLTRWKQLMFEARLDDTVVTTAPSPNNRIPGIVVLLYGRGGFGKSTLLRHYHEIAVRPARNLIVSKIIDWEFAVEGKRGLFILPQTQDIDAYEYFRVLCGQLAIALNKKHKEFREYHLAVKDVENARKQASAVLERMQGEDRYAALRGMTIDTLVMMIGALTPTSLGKILENEKFKGVINQGVKVGIEQLAQVRSKLHDELGNKLGDYLDSPLHLGLALGRDLYEFAKNLPMLIFFDTYEEVDEGDHLLRVVMGAAGLRVGWILAGRDNLWAGLSQIERSKTLEYGYKEIVQSDRGLSIDFNGGGVGAFTISDIKSYFDLLCQKVQYEPPLPKVALDGAKRIMDVTQ